MCAPTLSDNFFEAKKQPYAGENGLNFLISYHARRFDNFQLGFSFNTYKSGWICTFFKD